MAKTQTSYTQVIRPSQLKLTGASFDKCTEIIAALSSRFAYQPNIDVVADAMLATGAFTPIDVANNISQAFQSPSQSSRRGFFATLSEESYRVVKQLQSEITPYFKYRADLYMMVNALIQTGTYDLDKLSNHIAAGFALLVPEPNSQINVDTIEPARAAQATQPIQQTIPATHYPDHAINEQIEPLAEEVVMEEMEEVLAAGK